jgi:hypothetical protein
MDNNPSVKPPLKDMPSFLTLEHTTVHFNKLLKCVQTKKNNFFLHGQHKGHIQGEQIA